MKQKLFIGFAILIMAVAFASCSEDTEPEPTEDYVKTADEINGRWRTNVYNGTANPFEDYYEFTFSAPDYTLQFVRSKDSAGKGFTESGTYKIKNGRIMMTKTGGGNGVYNNQYIHWHSKDKVLYIDKDRFEKY